MHVSEMEMLSNYEWLKINVMKHLLQPTKFSNFTF